MVKAFLGVVVLWMVGLVFMVAHYLFFDKDSYQVQLSTFVSMTGFSSPSLSSDFYEPRLLSEEGVHPTYPHMLPINRMDFVYVR